MALSAISLRDRIKAKVATVAAQQFTTAGNIGPYRDDVLLALAEAIVEEIQANAQVPVTGGSSAGTYPVQ